MENNIDKKIINKFKKIMYDNISYTNQDFESIMTEMISLIRNEEFPVKWNNLTETDPIVMLFALFAAHKDILNYMIDYRIGESYMTTARERASMIRIAQSFGYKIPSYSAARAQYEVQSTISLESFQSFTDANGIVWTYVGKDEEFTNGDFIDLFQGTPRTVEINPNLISERLKNIVVSSENIAIDNSYDSTEVVKLIDPSGKVTFNYIDNLIKGIEDKNYFSLDVDPLGMTFIQFSQDLNLNQFSQSLKFTYLVTMGDSHISPQDIVEEDINLTYKQGTYFRGKNPATDYEIKEGFKNFYSGLDTLVTVNDYKNYILNIQKDFPEIKKCHVLDKQTDSSGGDGNVDIPDFTVVIFAANYDEDDKEYKPLTNEPGESEIEGLLKVLEPRGITGLNIKINSYNKADITPEEPVNLTPVGEVAVKIIGSVDEDKKEEIEETIKQSLLHTNIGALLTVKDITQSLIDKDLLKYFDFGSNIMFEINSSTALSLQLEHNQYIAKASDISVSIESGIEE